MKHVRLTAAQMTSLQNVLVKLDITQLSGLKSYINGLLQVGKTKGKK